MTVGSLWTHEDFCRAKPVVGGSSPIVLVGRYRTTRFELHEDEVSGLAANLSKECDSRWCRLGVGKNRPKKIGQGERIRTSDSYVPNGGEGRSCTADKEPR